LATVSEPLAPWRAGCAGRAGNGHCGGRVEFAGLAYFEHSRRVWLSFACADHRGQLIAARPVTEADRVEIARRKEEYRRVVEDHVPYVKPEPLASGQGARELVERARVWAERAP
jgi:hypothetical protein